MADADRLQFGSILGVGHFASLPAEYKDELLDMAPEGRSRLVDGALRRCAGGDAGAKLAFEILSESIAAVQVFELVKRLQGACRA